MTTQPLDPSLPSKSVALLQSRIRDAERMASELRELAAQLLAEGDESGCRVVSERARRFDRRAQVLRLALAGP